MKAQTAFDEMGLSGAERRSRGGLLTRAAPLVRHQRVPAAAAALVAPLRVGAAQVTAPILNGALVDICEGQGTKHHCQLAHFTHCVLEGIKE